MRVLVTGGAGFIGSAVCRHFILDLGHEVTVIGPADEGTPVPSAAGEHFVIGRPTAVRSNGSVAPVALWPTASARAERFAGLRACFRFGASGSRSARQETPVRSRRVGMMFSSLTDGI